MIVMVVIAKKKIVRSQYEENANYKKKLIACLLDSFFLLYYNITK